jgi:NAD+ synthase (glutamine-hydrolysing)
MRCLTGASGFLLPLSGGADSSAVATIVGVMCNLVLDAIKEGNEQVLRDTRRIMGMPQDADHRCGVIRR